MLDTARAALSRVTSDESTGNSWPVWTPDGKRVVFRSVNGMRWIDVDSGGPPHAITGTSVADRPSSISPDGRALAFLRASAETSSDLYVLSLDGEPNPRGVRGWRKWRRWAGPSGGPGARRWRCSLARPWSSLCLPPRSTRAATLGPGRAR